jgi:hypothetical protein
MHTTYRIIYPFFGLCSFFDCIYIILTLLSLSLTHKPNKKKNPIRYVFPVAKQLRLLYCRWIVPILFVVFLIFKKILPFICLIKFIPNSLRPQKNDEDNERSPPPLKCNSISFLCFFFSWKTIGNNQPQSRDDDDVFWMKLWKTRPDVHHQRRLNEREYRNE